MDLVPRLNTGSLIQLWRQLQVGGWEVSSGGYFGQLGSLSGSGDFGIRGHLMLGLGSLRQILEVRRTSELTFLSTWSTPCTDMLRFMSHDLQGKQQPCSYHILRKGKLF